MAAWLGLDYESREKHLISGIWIYTRYRGPQSVEHLYFAFCLLLDVAIEDTTVLILADVYFQ